MTDKKSKTTGAIIFILVLAIGLMSLLIHIRDDNAESFDQQIKNPEGLFNGTFTDVRDWKNELKLIKGDDICVSVSNQNLNYDEKNLILQIQKSIYTKTSTAILSGTRKTPCMMRRPENWKLRGTCVNMTAWAAFCY